MAGNSLLRYLGRRAAWLFVAMAIMALIGFVKDSRAHWDGDPPRDGHYYEETPVSGKYGSPHSWADAYLATFADGCDVESVLFDTMSAPINSRWAVVISRDIGIGCQNAAAKMIQERHCAVGEVLSGDEGECGPPLSLSCDYGDETVSYAADENPGAWANVEDPVRDQTCLWQNVGESAVGGCYAVTYEATRWRESDEDDWTVAQNDGNLIGEEPATCPGEDEPAWPWTTVGSFDPGDITDEGRCPEGAGPYWVSPYPFGDPHSKPATACWLGCRIEPAPGDPTSETCAGVPGDGTCGGTFKLTGEACDGGELYTFGDGGEEGTTDGAVLAELRKIYNRQATVGAVAAAGAAATVAGLAVINESIKDLEGAGGAGGGECESESCEGETPTLGETGTVEEGGQSFGDRVAASDIGQMLSGAELPSGTCMTVDTDSIASLDNEVYTIDAHCTVWAEIEPTVGAVMLSFWSLTGIFIIWRA